MRSGAGRPRLPPDPAHPRRKANPPKPGRGRQKQSPPRQPDPPREKVKGEVIIGGLVCPSDCEPVEFLLGLMRNPDLPTGFRRLCAVDAAPYRHAKVSELGKKAQADVDARDAERGSNWDGLLN